MDYTPEHVKGLLRTHILEQASQSANFRTEVLRMALEIKASGQFYKTPALSLLDSILESASVTNPNLFVVKSEFLDPFQEIVKELLEESSRTLDIIRHTVRTSVSSYGVPPETILIGMTTGLLDRDRIPARIHPLFVRVDASSNKKPKPEFRALLFEVMQQMFEDSQVKK